MKKVLCGLALLMACTSISVAQPPPPEGEGNNAKAQAAIAHAMRLESLFDNADRFMHDEVIPVLDIRYDTNDPVGYALKRATWVSISERATPAYSEFCEDILAAVPLSPNAFDDYLIKRRAELNVIEVLYWAAYEDVYNLY